MKNFYNDDEFAKPLPGKKDYISVRVNGEKNQIQKRLLLGNLAELYEVFKTQHPDVKVSLAKFCTLRPKSCKPVGSPGGHNVCVCQKHQNTVLAAFALVLSYKGLISN